MSIPNPHYIIVSSKLGPSKKPKHHQTEEDALAEAERLALLHRDDSFQVYKSHRFVKARMVDVFDNSECPEPLRVFARRCSDCGGFSDNNGTNLCDDCIPF